MVLKKSRTPAVSATRLNPYDLYALLAWGRSAGCEGIQLQLPRGSAMKIKTSLRAGKSINYTVVSYVSPISRCAGL
jgi:hypothetical protein